MKNVLIVLLLCVAGASCHLTGWSLWGSTSEGDSSLEGWDMSRDGSTIGVATHFAPNHPFGVGDVPKRREPIPVPIIVPPEPVCDECTALADRVEELEHLIQDHADEDPLSALLGAGSVTSIVVLLGILMKLGIIPPITPRIKEVA